jgi:predicted transcriptional regulator
MALSDSILLQISQKKTNYNDLLTKMVSNYVSVNSAKAALSRALKNLVAFGEIEKNKNDYFLTEKGRQTIESKLKNKILININELLNKSRKKSSLEHVDDIVKNLQIFLERSKQDVSFLKTGKTGSSFYISDLEILKKEIDSSVAHYTYISSVLTNHIKILQNENFEDYFVLNLDENLFLTFYFLIELYNIKELTIDCSNQYPQTISFFESNEVFVKKNNFTFKLQLKNFEILKSLLLKDFERSLSIRFKIYLNDVLVKFSFGKVYFFGPFSIITKIKKKNLELKSL